MSEMSNTGKMIFDTCNALNNEMLAEVLREENKLLREKVREQEDVIERLKNNSLQIFENLGEALGSLSKLKEIMKER